VKKEVQNVQFTLYAMKVNRMADRPNTSEIVKEIETLTCKTNVRLDGTEIDHVAIREGNRTILVARYEIIPLIEHLMELHDIGE